MKPLELDFDGRTLLITGAATGIGRATALALQRRVLMDNDMQATS